MIILLSLACLLMYIFIEEDLIPLLVKIFIGFFSLNRKLVVRHCFKLSIRISDPCTCILNICLKWGFGWSGLNDVLFIPVILNRGRNTHRLKGDYKP